MVRKSAFVVVLLAVWSLPCEPQAVEVIRSNAPEQEAAKVADLGDPGQILDNLTVTAEATPGECVTTQIGEALLESYCGDRDGCTLRFVASSSSDWKPHPSEAFLFHRLTGEWRVTEHGQNGTVLLYREHEDGVEDSVIEMSLWGSEGPEPACRFFDDYVVSGQLTAVVFGLEACRYNVNYDSAACTLTIED